MNGQIENAVQPARWFEALPRDCYRKLTRVRTRTSWFEVYDLPADVLAIYEPGHFQEVISYLIQGEEQALLLDTGMGIGDMRALIDELTDKPLIVVNSHCHFDHIGCDWQFEAVHIYDDPGAIETLRRGLPAGMLASELSGDSTCGVYPQGFDPAQYRIRPATPRPIHDGHIFDLGGRHLEVIHTPGHSPDSIMLLDRENDILFTGDTFYPATLYTHLRMPHGVHSDFVRYHETMRRLAEAVNVSWLYTSHNEPVVPGSVLKAVADAFADIDANRVVYETDADGLRKYSFDGFAIVTANPPTGPVTDLPAGPPSSGAEPIQ